MAGMKTMNRREMLVVISAMATLHGLAAEAQPASGRSGETMLSRSKVYPFDELPVVHLDHGQQDQPVLQGVLPTGEALEVHETTLQPGQMPHPPHKHRHSELMLVRDGTLEFDNDGKRERTGPGGVFFVGSNVTHAVKCVGDVPANYYVIAIGRESLVQPALK
jgi:quercetin dioxygenase-like cupin family protein